MIHLQITGPGGDADYINLRDDIDDLGGLILIALDEGQYPAFIGADHETDAVLVRLPEKQPWRVTLHRLWAHRHWRRSSYAVYLRCNAGIEAVCVDCGNRTNWGTVEEADKSMVVCQDEGHDTYLLPAHTPDRTPIPDHPGVTAGDLRRATTGG